MKIYMLLAIFPFFLETSSILCPDLSSCFLFHKCCPVVIGYGCCPIPFGVCCSDLQSCCPPGFLCMGGQICIKKPGPKDVLPVVCEGGKYVCPPRHKCCPNENKTDGCCVFSNAVECKDGVHYCPPGTECSEKGNTCIGLPEMSNAEEFVLSMSLSPSFNESTLHLETPWFTKGKLLLE